MKTMLTVVSSAIALAVLTACASQPTTTPGASAQLEPTRGNAVSGKVVFTPIRGQVLVTASVTGLKPNSEHGFHIHEKGDCSAPDGTSAGGHFNPAAAAHARHAGDFPNLKADAAGNAIFRIETGAISLSSGAANDVIGRAVVIHANPDDYASQPAGNSGARVACGVIKAS